MEVVKAGSAWISRLDGAGEPYKSTWLDEITAKAACLEAARGGLNRKNLTFSINLTDPEWLMNETWADVIWFRDSLWMRQFGIRTICEDVLQPLIAKLLRRKPNIAI